MKRVLMIAFHFPPAAMGSGHLRTLGFARYLPDLGWEPTVLSACATAYPHIQASNNQLIPEHCHVHRALALDVRRHLAIRGRYPGFLAQPDGWASWWPAAVWQGMRLIRRHRFDAIWSTYPIMSAHRIGRTLSRLSGLPWIADFRDPVESSVEAGNRFSVASQRRGEQDVLAHADQIVFTTPGARRRCAETFPSASCGQRLNVIPNGYDEATFVDLPPPTPRKPGQPLRLVHSGMLYPDGRNPLPFFSALASLKKSGRLSANDLAIVLRASGSEARYAEQIRYHGLEDMITLAAPVSHGEALREQANADGLLLFQGAVFNRQIPAKVYEYLRIGRPIFALLDETGDTADVLRDTGGASLVAIDDTAAIGNKLSTFINELREGQAPRPQAAALARYSRREGAASLARLLQKVSGT